MSCSYHAEAFERMGSGAAVSSSSKRFSGFESTENNKSSVTTALHVAMLPFYLLVLRRPLSRCSRPLTRCMSGQRR
jgi:hypothetical protein